MSKSMTNLDAIIDLANQAKKENKLIEYLGGVVYYSPSYLLETAEKQPDELGQQPFTNFKLVEPDERLDFITRKLSTLETETKNLREEKQWIEKDVLLTTAKEREGKYYTRTFDWGFGFYAPISFICRKHNSDYYRGVVIEFLESAFSTNTRKVHLSLTDDMSTGTFEREITSAEFYTALNKATNTFSKIIETVGERE